MKKSRITKLLAIMFVLVCAIAAFTLTACGGGGSKAQITLNPETLLLYENGKDGTIRATLSPANNNAAYEWTIDNEDIASIKATQSICKVSPKKEGTATVTVTAGKATATCAITVGPDQHVQLLAPSFTYDEETTVISITDPNTVGVGSYRLDFYAHESTEGEDGEEVTVGTEVSGSVTVKDGEKVDLRRIDKGTYTVRLVAVGANDLYRESEPSESTATITVETEALYELGKGDDAVLAAGPGAWGYYVFDWVIADTEETYCYDGEVTFTFSNNTSDNIKDYAWITQLIYNHGKTDTSKLYKMQLKIEVPVECRISMGVNNNFKYVSLHPDVENLVTVGFRPVNDAKNNLFKIRFAVAGEPFTIKEGTVKFSVVGNILETEEKMLGVPSFSYDKDTKIITINDDVNNEYDVDYTLGFFENLNDAAPKGIATVKNGEEVDTSSVLSGSYYLRLMAASTGLPYMSSGWTAPDENATIGVKNTRVDIKYGTEGDSRKNADDWYYWFPTANMNIGPATTVDYVYINLHDDGSETIHVRYQNAGNYQPLKLLYMRSDVKPDDLYKLSFKLQSPTDGKITVNGQVFDVTAGENEIEVVRVQPAKTGNGSCTITIQFGAGSSATDVWGFIACNGDDEEIVISELAISDADPIQLQQITSFDYVAEKQHVVIVDPNDYETYSDAKVQYELGYFMDGELVKSKYVANEDGFEHPNLAPGVYTLKLRIKPGTPLYNAPDWFEPETPITITIVNENYTEDIVSGNNAAAAGNPEHWYYYKQGSTTVTHAYTDVKGDVYVSYNYSGTSNEPLKLLWMSKTMEDNQEYTLSCKITSPVAARIRVNNVEVDLQQGVNEVSVTRKQPSKSGGDGNRCTITITFGSGTGDSLSQITSGEIVVSDIKLSTQQLAAPSFEYDGDTKVVTVTDTNDAADVKEYQLGIFNADGTLVKTLTVANNDTVDFTAQELEAGAYTVKIRAVSPNGAITDYSTLGNSEWASAETEVTVTIAE